MNYIELAKQAGWDAHHAEFDTRIQTFAALVAAQERRECAKLCAEVGAWALVQEIEARGEA